MKVTEKIRRAILNHSNLSVWAVNDIMGLRGKRYEIIAGDPMIVKLWGHTIAEIGPSVVIRNCGYFTKITKNTLNIVLEVMGRGRIEQRNKKWWLNGLEWDGNDVVL